MLRRSSLRTGIAWLVLLTLALPGFASVRGLCCEPGPAKNPGCCVAAMKMAGMSSSEMASMDADPVMEGHSAPAAVAQCAPGLASELPEFVGRSEGSLERDLLPAQGQLFSLAGNVCAELSASVNSPSYFASETPPKLFLFDPLSVSLRI